MVISAGKCCGCWGCSGTKLPKRWERKDSQQLWWKGKKPVMSVRSLYIVTETVKESTKHDQVWRTVPQNKRIIDS